MGVRGGAVSALPRPVPRAGGLLGRHLLVELYGCPPERLDDLDAVRAALEEGARRGCCRVVEAVFHRFEPQGLSGVVVLAESHLSVHTWPEYGCAALDLFTCSEAADLESVVKIIRERLGARRAESQVVPRGRRP